MSYMDDRVKRKKSGLTGLVDQTSGGDIGSMDGLSGLLALAQSNPRVIYPLIAQMLGTGSLERIRKINEAAGEGPGSNAPVGTTGTAPAPAPAPGVPQRSTAELLRAIDSMAIKPTESKPAVRQKIDVIPVTIMTRDGEELKYKDRKTGKLYDYDPNE
jgi:hypothetical protein